MTFDQSIIATVAFNRPDVLEWQIHLVRKYLAERDSYIVFDNSSSRADRKANRDLCRREAVPYVSLPIIAFKGSFSHGAALNWITQNFVKPRSPDFFGFLDHDIFPVAPFSVAERMSGRKAYGHRASHRGAWYLWPGFCFYSGVPIASLDFSPVSDPVLGFLDTGGANWKILYQNIDELDVGFIDIRKILVDEQGNYFQDFDGWIHAGGVARWYETTNRPDHRAQLARLLKEAGGDRGPNVALRRVTGFLP